MFVVNTDSSVWFMLALWWLSGRVRHKLTGSELHDSTLPRSNVPSHELGCSSNVSIINSSSPQSIEVPKVHSWIIMILVDTVPSNHVTLEMSRYRR